jgi:hypothetical protein
MYRYQLQKAENYLSRQLAGRRRLAGEVIKFLLSRLAA